MFLLQKGDSANLLPFLGGRDELRRLFLIPTGTLGGNLPVFGLKFEEPLSP